MAISHQTEVGSNRVWNRNRYPGNRQKYPIGYTEQGTLPVTGYGYYPVNNLNRLRVRLPKIGTVPVTGAVTGTRKPNRVANPAVYSLCATFSARNKLIVNYFFSLCAKTLLSLY